MSCNGLRPRPQAPEIQRCIISLQSGIEICFNYRIDVLGGHTDRDTEVRRPITDKSVTFSLDEWEKLMNWRDETVLWAEEAAKLCKKNRRPTKSSSH